jgi:hypothetical protein
MELPVAVTPWLRIPVIGTFLAMFGPRLTRPLVASLVGQPLINLEFHGIDLLDAGDEGLSELAKVQRDLQIPLSDKLSMLFSIVNLLRFHGYEFVTLDTAYERIRVTG